MSNTNHSQQPVSAAVAPAADQAALLEQAAREYMRRQARASDPDGTFDKGGRWWPEDHEECACCEYIRRPSRAWPYSWLVHCRTAEHVASLYEVNKTEMMRIVRSLRN